MALLPDLTKFIFKVMYSRQNTIIIPCTFSELEDGLRFSKKYKIYILTYQNFTFNWVLIHELKKVETKLENIFFDINGKRLSILPRKYTIEVLKSHGDIFKVDKLDPKYNRSRLLLYFMHTRKDCKIKFISRTGSVFDFNRINNNQSLRDIISKTLRFIHNNDQSIFRIHLLFNDMDINLDKLIAIYNEYHTGVYDPVFKFNTINPVIDTLYSSLFYLNAFFDCSYRSHDHTIYKQLNAIEFDCEFKFIRRKLPDKIDVNMYEVKGMKHIDGAIVYTKDCLLRIINAK